MDNSKTIGIFDSGVGGITVLKAAMDLMPNENFYYYADTEHVPYGTKTKDEVIKLVIDSAHFLFDHKVKAIVIACNTATSTAVNELRAIYQIPIIGMEPAVKPAVDNRNNKRVLVCATPLTLKEKKFKDLLEKTQSTDVVDTLPLPELVDLAEDGRFDSEEVIGLLETKFSDFNMQQYSSVVLGCTHFIYFKDHFRQIIPPDIELFDGNEGTVRNLHHILESRDMLRKSSAEGKVVFYSSDMKKNSNERLHLYLNRL
jgi:glutamate racemase